MRPSRARTVGSGVLPNYTLDTLFGVKGTIRLVAQSGAPKAHILLKREFYNEESLCPEPIAGIARFTLVANKRFTASKGQTLCLSIEDPAADDDMKLLYGENAVALEFDYDDESDLSEPEDEGEESEDIGVDKHAKNFMAVKEMRRRGVAEMGSLPAKMRKSLAGASTYNTFAERQPPNSLGFPGYPLNTPEPRVLASAATQTERMEDKTPPANALPLKHAEYLSPLSLISNNNHIFHRLDHAQPSAILSPVPYTQSEGSDFQNVVSPPRSPSLMDLSTTTTSLPGSPEDPPWTSSSPTNDQAALPLPSTAATTPTPSPKLELHPQECDSPREVALLMFNDQAEKETKVLHSSIELAKHSISSVPTDPHQDEDMFSLETFFVESQTSSNPIHFPLQPGNRTSFSSSSQSMEDSATLPTPLATPTPLSRSFNTPPKQQTAQLDPPQSEICNVQPSPSTSVQSLPDNSSLPDLDSYTTKGP
ncbi:hypothetical protein CPB83DRAFT_482785 [Crepidotus variabilis]|uniref:Uncharacterized protein n=1 Tax=Crepidotus variabilis TaxID=179855 RepID=A0A9P6EPI3_9AGAR|nr:hypothetical protein CPB83DRAFT_482785 [Crepidotus variabilis]